MILNPYIPCDVPRQSDGSTQILSLTGYEPKSVEINAIDTEAIEPEDFENRRIELERNFGTDVAEFGKVGAEDALPPVTDAFRLRLSGEHCRLGS